MGFFFDNDSITPTKGDSGGGGSAVIEELNVTPTTSAQVITAPSGTDGYNPVNVSAVTSSIDNNIVAGNIKNGITILGVTGTLSGGEKFGASLNSIIGDIDGNGVLQAPTVSTDLVFTGVTDLAYQALQGKFQATNVTSVSFPDLTSVTGGSAFYETFFMCQNLTSFSAPNLQSISGANTFRDAFKQTKLQSINLSSLQTIIGTGYYCCQGMFSIIGNGLTSLTFPALTTISGGYAAYEMFYNLISQITPSFPELTTISGSYVANGMFRQSRITGLSVPKLTTVTGEHALQEFMSQNSVIEELHFPELTTLSGDNICNQAFSSCYALKKVYFDKLTTISGTQPFGGNFTGMFAYSTALTEIHFKSDMQPTISAITGYANKWGASNATIYFDL